MDESEQQEYERVVFGVCPFEEKPTELRQEIWDEDGRVPGCYVIAPAPVE